MNSEEAAFLFLKEPRRFLHPGLVVSWLSRSFLLLPVALTYSFACTPVIWRGPKIKGGKQKRNYLGVINMAMEQKSLIKK